ncbi:MAG: hypothetical protein Q8S84_07300 [bacterium]|nr:hypothetical protein [bacterium]MDP3381258.1 hypothetical protein [bacterium]
MTFFKSKLSTSSIVSSDNTQYVYIDIIQKIDDIESHFQAIEVIGIFHSSEQLINQSCLLDHCF